MENDIVTIWSVLKNEPLLIKYCKENNDKEFFTVLHPDFNINVLQWLLWYVGSGVRSFVQVKYGSFSRKDWAFHKIEILYNNLSKEIWKELVHSSTGFSNKCKTIHYFTRNAYTIDIKHLEEINKMFDSVNGRFAYSHIADEYGYTPGKYVEFHRKRQEIFRKKAKTKVDNMVKKYHELESSLKNELHLSTMIEYYDEIKERSNQGFIENNPIIRKKIIDIIKSRIEVFLIHENLFNDELTKIEKEEEKLNRGLSQVSNHSWIINAYKNIIKGTNEEKIINNYLSIKKINLYNDTTN